MRNSIWAEWSTRSIGIALALLCLTGSVAAAAAADFRLPDLTGKHHRLSDYRGKWVVVNYWATWCPPCLEELPELEIFHDGNAATRAVVLGVNMEQIGVERLRAFVEDQFLSYPILVGGATPGQLLGKVPGLPTSFLVNRRGEVVARRVGPVTAQALEHFIARYEAQQQARPIRSYAGVFAGVEPVDLRRAGGRAGRCAGAGRGARPLARCHRQAYRAGAAAGHCGRSALADSGDPAGARRAALVHW